MLLGFVYPLITFLFCWIGKKMSKMLSSNPSLSEPAQFSLIPVAVLGMIGSSFWPPFFLGYTLGTPQYILQLLGKITVLATFGVRFTTFWYQFSENDRKKLYAISVAKEKFLDYQQRYLKHTIIFLYQYPSIYLPLLVQSFPFIQPFLILLLLYI